MALTVSLDDKAALINPDDSVFQLISISVCVSTHAINKRVFAISTLCMRACLSCKWAEVHYVRMNNCIR